MDPTPRTDQESQNPTAALSRVEELAAGQKDDLDRILIGDVVRQFLEYIESVKAIDLDLTARFLSIAARLMALKSALLLAQPLNQEDRLDQGEGESGAYRLEILEDLPTRLKTRLGSESLPPLQPPVELPTVLEPRSPLLLQRTWETLMERMAESRVPISVPAFLRLDVVIGKLKRGLKRQRRLSLRRVLGRATRREAVVHFLAALELIRTGEATASQKSLFDDIALSPNPARRNARARAG